MKGQALLLLLLLGILGAGGGWNYRRNLAEEQKIPRPFSTLSEVDLAQLKLAYESEVEQLTNKYARATGHKIQIREGGLVGDQIREFERVQRLSRGVRELGFRIAEQEGSAQELQNELDRREAERDKFKLFLRRVFTYRS